MVNVTWLKDITIDGKVNVEKLDGGEYPPETLVEYLIDGLEGYDLVDMHEVCEGVYVCTWADYFSDESEDGGVKFLSHIVVED